MSKKVLQEIDLASGKKYFTELKEATSTETGFVKPDGTTTQVDENGTMSAIIGELGSTTFTGLTDVPSSYSGQGGKYVKVNTGANALEFGTLPTIPDQLSDLTDDSTHRTVTDTEKSTWNSKLTGNTAITEATKTKITYDSKGLITSGADATTADITDSTDKRYVTDAQLTVIGNTSGTNTGDETASTIKTKLGITTLSGSNTGDQDLSGKVDKELGKGLSTNDFSNDYKDQIDNTRGIFTISTLEEFISALENTDFLEKHIYNNNNTSLTTTGNITINLYGKNNIYSNIYIENTDEENFTITINSYGSIYFYNSLLLKCIANGTVTITSSNSNSIFVRTIYPLSSSSTVNATGNLYIYYENLNSDSNGNLSGNFILYNWFLNINISDYTYTDEMAQDAVGGILTDSTEIYLNYSDVTPSITASLKSGSITNSKLSNMAQNTIKGRITASTGAPEDLTAANVRSIINVADGATANTKATGAEIDTGTDDVKFATAKAIADSKLSYIDGTETLTNKTLTSPKINENVAITATATELNYCDGVTSAIQTQINTLKETVLYAPETPETSGTLTDSVANYDYIEVFYNFGGAKDGSYGNNSVKIYQANNTKAALVLPVYSDGYTYLVTGQVSFSGKTFTSFRPYRTRLATTPGITITNVDSITLYRVVGYKIL